MMRDWKGLDAMKFLNQSKLTPSWCEMHLGWELKLLSPFTIMFGMSGCICVDWLCGSAVGTESSIFYDTVAVHQGAATATADDATHI